MPPSKPNGPPVPAKTRGPLIPVPLFVTRNFCPTVINSFLVAMLFFLSFNQQGLSASGRFDL
jgi:hypothetical protein